MGLRTSRNNSKKTRSKYNRKNKNSQKKDKEVVRVVEEMKKIGVKVLRDDEQQIEEELVLKEEKIYILKNEELRLETIQLHYNILVAGYRK